MRYKLASLALILSCSASPPTPRPEPPPKASAQPGDPADGWISTTTAAPSATDDAVVVNIPTAATATAAVSTTPPPPPPPSDCPAGMKLVEGDYCTKVKQKCLVEWWAPQNRKRVCEQFKPPTQCIGKRVPKRFCIDTYSWPNKRGTRPEVMNNFYQAQVKCAAMGKRMCTESEWTFACEGPEMKPFPHGYVRDPAKCNGDHKWDGPNMKKVAKRDPTELARLWLGVPSGSQPDCVSDFGVADLPANNDEVVASETARYYSSVHTGGPWYSGVRNQCRPKVYTHDEGFYYYFLGFRCCSNPKGQPNEPRTPKQVKSRTKWKSIEGWASFSVDQMKQVLKLKEQGQCNCQGNKLPGGLRLRGPSWICKTMCGTLLGPGATNGTAATRVPDGSRKRIKLGP